MLDFEFWILNGKEEEEVSGQRSKVIREVIEKTMDHWILDNLGIGRISGFSFFFNNQSLFIHRASAPLTSLHYVHANRLR
jgi:hypothetical protein